MHICTFTVLGLGSIRCQDSQLPTPPQTGKYSVQAKIPIKGVCIYIYLYIYYCFTS